MTEWWKKIRAALGVGVTWGAFWGLFGGVLGFVMGATQVGIGAALDVALLFARQHAMLGLVGGASFATLLRLAEGRRSFAELSIPRFAAWGALGGLLIGAGWEALMGLQYGVGLSGIAVQTVVVSGLLGSVSAAGSLAVARDAEDRELLDESDQTAAVGLSDQEKAGLLGDPSTTG